MTASDFLRYRQIHLDFHTSEQIVGIGAEFDADAWAQMLAADEDALMGEAAGVGDLAHIVDEAGRRDAGVAAELVDLVAGGFDEDGGVARQGLSQAGFDHAGMGGADGRDAEGLAVLLGGYDVGEISLFHERFVAR